MEIKKKKKKWKNESKLKLNLMMRVNYGTSNVDKRKFVRYDDDELKRKNYI